MRELVIKKLLSYNTVECTHYTKAWLVKQSDKDLLEIYGQKENSEGGLKVLRKQRKKNELDET